MANFRVVLESVDSPGKFTFVDVDDAKDLEDCINSIRTEWDHQFTVEQITQVTE
jgi:hypothetical protein